MTDQSRTVCVQGAFRVPIKDGAAPAQVVFDLRAESIGAARFALCDAAERRLRRYANPTGASLRLAAGTRQRAELGWFNHCAWRVAVGGGSDLDVRCEMWYVPREGFTGMARWSLGELRLTTIATREHPELALDAVATAIGVSIPTSLLQRRFAVVADFGVFHVADVGTEPLHLAVYRDTSETPAVSSRAPRRWICLATPAGPSQRNTIDALDDWYIDIISDSSAGAVRRLREIFALVAADPDGLGAFDEMDRLPSLGAYVAVTNRSSVDRLSDAWKRIITSRTDLASLLPAFDAETDTRRLILGDGVEIEIVLQSAPVGTA